MRMEPRTPFLFFLCPFAFHQFRFLLSITILTSLLLATTHAATFTFVNRCSDTVWPGVLPNSGSASLGTTGFELPSGTSRSFQAPAGWSGRMWARTGCSFGPDGRGSCLTGDCGSGQVDCNGAGAAPPATLAEFTLNGDGGNDFYDVSLVDGYNLPMVVDVVGSPGAASGGAAAAGKCVSTGCPVDMNRACPTELRTAGGDACRSACEAFGRPEYCCSGDFANPTTCRPSVYAAMFKNACPRAYSYAYDDATSTFTCTNGDYTLTFCPAAGPSLKSSSTSASQSMPQAAATTEAAEGNRGWLENLATGDAVRARGMDTSSSLLLRSLLIAASTYIILLLEALPCYPLRS